MSSLRQIAANRRNALKSTGPITAEGKERSRGNAVRHGLTAETVIAALEDQEDYQAFEAAVIADYDFETAVERELVLRLASVLWRLRRATGIETALFELVSGGPHKSERRRVSQTLANQVERNRPLLRAVPEVDVVDASELTAELEKGDHRQLPAPDKSANLRPRSPQSLRAHAVAAGATACVHAGVVAASQATVKPFNVPIFVSAPRARLLVRRVRLKI